MIARRLVLSVLLGVMCFGARAQESLSEMVSQANAEWMLGTWQGSSDDGNTVTIAFSWDLDKHVVVLQSKMGDVEIKGYSALDPVSREVKYVGFDNRGTVSKGGWGLEGGELTLRVESQTMERGPWKMAVVFAGEAASGLEARVHRIDDSGNLVTPARSTLKLKKAK